ncbi:hypothetical protein [Ornithinimicrobium kibberense]|uniref:hypothetical protein n=1 Tax=Ornithinimicrobium kibberense TaxID=282060 RepID=UPI003605EF12
MTTSSPKPQTSPSVTPGCRNSALTGRAQTWLCRATMCSIRYFGKGVIAVRSSWTTHPPTRRSRLRAATSGTDVQAWPRV